MKLVRELRFEDVRRLCIDNELFTNGDNEDYANLMFTICKLYTKHGTITDNDLITISEYILNHSITDYSLDLIITLLNEKILITLDHEKETNNERRK